MPSVSAHFRSLHPASAAVSAEHERSETDRETERQTDRQTADFPVCGIFAGTGEIQKQARGQETDSSLTLSARPSTAQ